MSLQGINTAVSIYHVNYYKEERPPVTGLYTALNEWGEATLNELSIGNGFLCH